MASITQVIYVTGILSLSYALYRVAGFLWTYLRPSRLYRYHHGAQPWACITGATDGIGLGIAHELASHNFNLILHGRNPVKLKNVTSSILELNPSIKILTYVFDTNEYKSIESTPFPKLIEGLNLTILVNNIGLGYETVTAEDVDWQINTNLRFATQLTRCAFPSLKSHSPSLVITMGSTAETGAPWVCVYAGAKAYLKSWCKSMRMQMKAEATDIEFLHLNMVEVTTVGNALEETFARPNARRWARIALRQAGFDSGVVHGYWVHALQRGFVDCLPERVKDMIVLPEMAKRRRVLGKSK